MSYQGRERLLLHNQVPLQWVRGEGEAEGEGEM
jgi:hypothetical protein